MLSLLRTIASKLSKPSVEQALEEEDSSDHDSDDNDEVEEFLTEQRCVDDPTLFLKLRQEMAQCKPEPYVWIPIEEELFFLEQLVGSLKTHSDPSKLICRRLIYLSLRCEVKASVQVLHQMETDLKYELASKKPKCWWKAKSKVRKQYIQRPNPGFRSFKSKRNLNHQNNQKK